MANNVTEAGSGKYLAATGTIPAASKCLGFLCSTSTGGTVAITDGATAMSGTIALTAGQFYPFPYEFAGVGTFTIGGTAGITVFWS